MQRQELVDAKTAQGLDGGLGVEAVVAKLALSGSDRAIRSAMDAAPSHGAALSTLAIIMAAIGPRPGRLEHRGSRSAVRASQLQVLHSCCRSSVHFSGGSQVVRFDDRWWGQQARPR